MKSMNKYLLLTSSAMIVARVASAALETDAKENKAVVNKLEFNRKYSELTPPTLVIPPFSSAKDYKRLAGICFLGVGDCGSGITFGKGDDYTKPCETINPCTGFNLTNTASCTDGYTICNTGCEDKFKCNPPQYTQTCEFPYQGVGTPKDGKYKSCECQAAFKYGTGDCPSPKVPDTSGTSCDGKYSSCICPSTYTEYCSSPYVGVGQSCNGLYQSCTCPNNYNKTCDGQNPVGSACDGLYSDCADKSCEELGYTETCNSAQKGVGEACDGKYKSCECRSDLVSCNSAGSGVGPSCGGLYTSCSCRSDLVSCKSPEVGSGASCGGRYESCTCPSSYSETCSGVYEGVGSSCNGKYQSCQCRSDLESCSGNYVGVGESCGGKYAACQCNSDFDQVCTGNQVCDNPCGGKCSSCYVPSSGGSGGNISSGGGGGGWGSSYDDSMGFCDVWSSYC